MKRVVLGYRAKTIDALGEVLEYTDPMPSPKIAIRYLRRHMTWLSWGGPRRYVAIRTTKVTGWR